MSFTMRETQGFHGLVLAQHARSSQTLRERKKNKHHGLGAMSSPDGLAVAGTLDAARESKAFPLIDL